MVADGRKQKAYVEKMSVASPTVHLESLMANLVISGYERDVASIDIGGAFLLSDIAEFILMKLDGEVVDVMCKANPSYGKFFAIEKKKNYYI